jgi:tetratricopeptide (TPR) repeat protein
MLCKESMVTAPLAIALYDRVFLFRSVREALQQRWRLYAGLAATWGVMALVVLGQSRTFDAGFRTLPVSAWTYLLNQTVIVTHYLRLTVWPDALVIFYGWAPPVTIAQIWPYAVFIALAALAVLWVFVREPRLGYCGVFFALTLGPTSSFAPIAGEVGAERRMYVPLAGLIALAVVGAMLFWGRYRSTITAKARPGRGRGSRVGAIALIVVTAALSARTVARNREYASGLTMARTVLERWPTPIAHDMMGAELALLGRNDEAIDHLRQAADGGYPLARFNLGVTLLKLGRTDEAIQQLQQFVHDEPEISVQPARSSLAQALMAKGRWLEAMDQLQILLVVDPNDSRAHAMLGEALAGQRAYADAIPHYQRRLDAEPRDVQAWSGLAYALGADGRIPEAVAAYRHAIELDPNAGLHHAALARVLIAQGALDDAASEARRATALGRDDEATQELAGVVLLTLGDFDAARAALTRAGELDPSNSRVHEALTNIPALSRGHHP